MNKAAICVKLHDHQVLSNVKVLSETPLYSVCCENVIFEIRLNVIDKMTYVSNTYYQLDLSKVLKSL